MSTRAAGIVMTPVESDEAKGVTIHRTIGSDKLILLDPFLLLDHLSVGASAEKEIGFPLHPHRGIETLTFVIRGRMHHKDSMGNDDSIGPGESQWMTAGAGIFHQEMVENTEAGHESLQIWLNLPQGGKMVPAAYQAARRESIPELTLSGGATVRVIAGTIEGATGPFTGIAAQPTYAEVRLPAGATVTLPAPQGQTAYAYLYAGVATFGEEETPAEAPNLVIFTDGDTVQATALEKEARFVFVCAKPYHEPVVQYRSLVMSTVEEMKQALDDLKNGTFA